MKKMKKMGATSILLLMTLCVFSILIISKRPMNLFKTHKKARSDGSITNHSITPPEESEYALKLISMNFTHSEQPLCGAGYWTGLPDDQCDIQPIHDALAWCETHNRLVENYPYSP